MMSAPTMITASPVAEESKPAEAPAESFEPTLVSAPAPTLEELSPEEPAEEAEDESAEEDEGEDPPELKDRKLSKKERFKLKKELKA